MPATLNMSNLLSDCCRFIFGQLHTIVDQIHKRMNALLSVYKITVILITSNIVLAI